MPKRNAGQLEAALNEVKKSERKISVREIAKKYGIPSSTLHNHVKQNVSQSIAGKPTILTQDEEQEVVYCCQVLQEMRFGLTKDNVGMIIHHSE
jgi:transposase-like protein